MLELDHYTKGCMYDQLGKRILDLCVAVMAILLLAPIFLFIGLVIGVRLGRPVLFIQERPGRHEIPFRMIKFRTMTDERDREGRVLSDSRRLTSLGRFLRATSLDELPELVNVIRGEMSLVGPRPLLMRYTPYFTPAERVRFDVRPGITGLAQVRGRNDLPWDERFALDVEYVRGLSIRLDLEILALTLWHSLTRRGLRVDPGATRLDLDVERGPNHPAGPAQR